MTLLLYLGVGETWLVFTINIFQVLFLKVNFCIGTYINVLPQTRLKNVQETGYSSTNTYLFFIGACCHIGDLLIIWFEGSVLV